MDEVHRLRRRLVSKFIERLSKRPFLKRIRSLQEFRLEELAIKPRVPPIELVFRRKKEHER